MNLTPEPLIQVPLTSEMKRYYGLSDEEARFWTYLPEMGEIQRACVGSPEVLALLKPSTTDTP